MTTSAEDLLRLIEDLEARVSALEATRPKKAKASVEDPRFDEFWWAYPKRANKEQARKAWATIPLKTRDLVVERAAEYGHVYDKATDEQLRFVPHPATWLNACGWEDDPKVWRANFLSHAPGAARKSSTQLPLVGKGEPTVLTEAQRTALADAQEARRKAERAELVERLKAQGKLPKCYVDGEDGK